MYLYLGEGTIMKEIVINKTGITWLPAGMYVGVIGEGVLREILSSPHTSDTTQSLHCQDEDQT
jgi:hypothetical protein